MEEDYGDSYTWGVQDGKGAYQREGLTWEGGLIGDLRYMEQCLKTDSEHQVIKKN